MTTAWIVVRNLFQDGTNGGSTASASTPGGRTDGDGKDDDDASRLFAFQRGDPVYDRKKDRIGRWVSATLLEREVSIKHVENETSTGSSLANGRDVGDVASSDTVEEPVSKKLKPTPQQAATAYFGRVAFSTANSIAGGTTNLEEEVVSRRHLVPMFAAAQHGKLSSSIPILVTERTDVYRLLAASQLRYNRIDECIEEGDAVAVLEIGSSTGGTSEVVWKVPSVHRWIGLDTSLDMVQAVQSKLKQKQSIKQQQRWQCRQMDPLKDPETAATLVREHLGVASGDNCHKVSEPQARRLVVLVDIGGNREEGAVLRMIQWVLQSFTTVSSPTSKDFPSHHALLVLDQVIVKSEAVHAALLEAEQQQQPPRQSQHPNDDDTPRPVVVDAFHSAWYKRQLRLALQSSLPKHPLKAPQRFQPGTTTPICRYFNYYKDGCAKHDQCPYNHSHCHVCLELGHIATACPLVSSAHHSPSV